MNYDPNTGQPINNGYQQVNNPNGTNGWAIAGLICSIIVGSITGLIFSFVGLGYSKKCNSGKGMSIAGIIISTLRILLIALLVALFIGTTSSQSKKCEQATGCYEFGFGKKICSYKNANGVTEDILCPINDSSSSDKKTNTNTYKKVKMYVFYGQGCPHCEDLFDYLDELKRDKNYKDKFEIVKFETWYDEDNADLMKEFADYFDINIYSIGVPFYIIGDEYHAGFPNPNASQSTLDKAHNQIKDAIDKNYGNSKAIDVYESIKKGTNY